MRYSRLKEMLAARRGGVDVPEPVLEDEADVCGEELPTFVEMDRDMLEACGYSEGSWRYGMVLENVVADDDEDKIFTMGENHTFSLNMRDMADRILEDEAFDRYWRTSLLPNLDPDRDAALVEQWNDGFIGEEVLKYLSGMKKGEKFYYIDFFRDILSKSESDEAVKLIDFEDDAFDEMPDVMRMY